MLSPIAAKSRREAIARGSVKGTGRRVTTYTAPSIEERIAGAPSIFALCVARLALAELFRAGELTPSESTRRRWNQALWVRVFELMLAAQTPEEATLVYNATMLWAKPDGVGEALEQRMARRVAAMPPPAARWRIEGVNA